MKKPNGNPIGSMVPVSIGGLNELLTKKKTVKIGLTISLSNVLQKARETVSPEEMLQIESRVGHAIHDEAEALRSLPDGKTKALIIHSRTQKSVDAHFKNSVKDKEMVSCFKCTRSGCCHTQVDITEDEAELYAGLIRDGLDIDKELLDRQAATCDQVGLLKTDVEKRSDDWGELSFEERKCIFLSKEGKCRVYDNRPMVCRKWFTTEDPKSCDDYNYRGIICTVFNAEIIASAAFTNSNSGRLPTMVKLALEKKTDGA